MLVELCCLFVILIACTGWFVICFIDLVCVECCLCLCVVGILICLVYLVGE